MTIHTTLLRSNILQHSKSESYKLVFETRQKDKICTWSIESNNGNRSLSLSSCKLSDPVVLGANCLECSTVYDFAVLLDIVLYVRPVDKLEGTYLTT